MAIITLKSHLSGDDEKKLQALIENASSVVDETLKKQVSVYSHLLKIKKEIKKLHEAGYSALEIAKILNGGEKGLITGKLIREFMEKSGIADSAKAPKVDDEGSHKRGRKPKKQVDGESGNESEDSESNDYGDDR